MADVQASADALLTEHLRYTPLSLIDDVINTINTIVYRAITAVETGLLGTPPATLGFQATEGIDAEEVKRVEIEDGVHRLETLLEATVDKNFDKFEIYALRNILCVDETLLPWVRLSHYKDLDLSLSSTTSTPSSIQILREKLQASESLSLALQQEAMATQNLLSQLSTLTGGPLDHTNTPHSQIGNDTNLQRATGSLSFLASHSTTSANPAPLTENASFATSQLPALRALLATLRPALMQLDAAHRPSAPSDVEVDRIARSTYVEGEVVRAVKGAVGVISDDADGAGFQRGIVESDVVGLEAVVAQRRREQ